MAPKGQKRGTDEVKKAANAKKPRKDSTTIAIEKVINNADLPNNCRELLLMSIAPSFETPSASRHEVQHLMVTMIGELIQSNESRLQGAVDAAQATETTCDATKSELAAKLADAEGILNAAIVVRDEKAAALSAASDKVENATKSLAEKQEIQTTGDAKMQETQSKITSVEKGINVDYPAIIDGAGGCDELLKVLKDIGCDDSLLQALPSTCKKAPGDRGSFDTMVLSQLEESLKKKLEGLKKTAEEEAPGVGERAAAVTAADKELQEVKAEQETASAVHDAADAKRLEAAATVTAAKADLKAHEPQVRAAVKARTQAKTALENFQQHTRVPFEALRDSSSVIETAAAVDTKVCCCAVKVLPVETDADTAVAVGGA